MTTFNPLVRTREDTVRQIVAGLTGDSDGTGDLAVELSKTDPASLETGQDSEDDSGEPEDWVPDPVDADPGQFTYWPHLGPLLVSLEVYFVLSCMLLPIPGCIRISIVSNLRLEAGPCLTPASSLSFPHCLATPVNHSWCPCKTYMEEQIYGKSVPHFCL